MGGGRLKGKANIVIDDCIIIKDILIINAKNGLCIDFQKSQKGYPIIVPMDRASRKELEEAILKDFSKTERNRRIE